MKAPYISVFSTSGGKRPSLENAHAEWETYQFCTYEVAYDPLTMGEFKDNFEGLPQWGLDNLAPYERAMGAMAYKGRMVTFRISRMSRRDGIAAIRAEIVVPGMKRITYNGATGLIERHSTSNGWQHDVYLGAVLDVMSKTVVWRTHWRYAQKPEAEYTELVGATIATVRSQTVAMMMPFLSAVDANWLPDIGLSTRTSEGDGLAPTTEQYYAIYQAVRSHVEKHYTALSHGGAGSYTRGDYDQIVEEVKRLLASENASVRTRSKEELLKAIFEDSKIDMERLGLIRAKQQKPTFEETAALAKALMNLDERDLLTLVDIQDMVSSSQ